MLTAARLQQIVQGLFFLFVISLPFQTRYIFSESKHQFAQLGIYGFDILWTILVIAFIFWWYTQHEQRIYWPLFWILSTLIMFVGASAYWTDHYNVALYYWLHLIQAVVVFGIVLSKAIQTKYVLLGFVVNGIIQSVFSIWQGTTQYIAANKWLGIAMQSPETSGVSVIATATGRWLRAYGTLPHPNIAGGILVVAILAAIILWATQKQTLIRYVASIGATISGFALVLTFSRGAVLILVASIIVLLAQRLGSLRISIATMLAMTVAAGIYGFIVQNRVSIQSSYTEQYSIDERRSQFSEAWNLFTTIWPYGTGIGTYTLQENELGETQPNSQPVHFLPLLIAVESGILVTLLIYTFLGWTFFRTNVSSALSLGLATMIAATIGLGFVDHYFWTLPTMLMLWWIILGLQWKSGRKLG